VIAFLVRRVAWALFVVAAVVTFVFALMFAFGDPAASTLGPNARAEQLQDFRARYGMDRPMLEQYLSYLGLGHCVRRTSPAYDEGRGRCGLLQGDFGESYSHNEPVIEVIGHRLPRTILLSGLAMTFELLLGLFVGILAAVRKQTWLDTLAMATAFLGISLPTFVTGPIFLDFVAFKAGLFPVGGYGVDLVDHLYHALLPAFTLAIVGAATYARIMRSELIETMRADYIRTARAKGLSPARVLFAHGVRNALLPIVTLMGLSMAFLVSGAIITEYIFAWPGMGALAIEAINNMDVFTVMGVVLIISLAVQAGNLLADVAVAALDPRVRLRTRG